MRGDNRFTPEEILEALKAAATEVGKRIPKPPIWGETRYDPNGCPTCGEDLGGECCDGIYENPWMERCPDCGQLLDYDGELVPVNPAPNIVSQAEDDDEEEALGAMTKIVYGTPNPLGEARLYECPYCHHEWLEFCDADEYPEYCPGCGTKIKPGAMYPYPNGEESLDRNTGRGAGKDNLDEAPCQPAEE